MPFTKAFESGMRTDSYHCYEDISESILAFVDATFLTEKVFNCEIHRKDSGSVRKDLADF